MAFKLGNICFNNYSTILHFLNVERNEELCVFAPKGNSKIKWLVNDQWHGSGIIFSSQKNEAQNVGLTSCKAQWN